MEKEKTQKHRKILPFESLWFPPGGAISLVPLLVLCKYTTKNNQKSALMEGMQVCSFSPRYSSSSVVTVARNKNYYISAGPLESKQGRKE